MLMCKQMNRLSVLVLEVYVHLCTVLLQVVQSGSQSIEMAVLEKGRRLKVCQPLLSGVVMCVSCTYVNSL